MGKFCPSFEVLSAYHDGEAAPSEASLVARHLPTCADCRHALESFATLATALTATAEVPCGVARQLVSADLDAELSAAEHAIVARHLAGCAACSALHAEWTGLDVVLRALPIAYPSPAADARIRGLTGHRRAPAPRYGRALGSVAVLAATIALVVFSAGQPGGGPNLVALPPQGGTLVASVQQVYNPINGLLYVLEPPKPMVFVRNPATQLLVKSITVGGAPSYMALSKETNTLYVLDPIARSYTAIDTDQNEVREHVDIAVDGTPTGIAVDTPTGKLVVTSASAPSANQKPSTLSVIDPSTRKLETVKQVEVAPTKIVVDSAANRLFLLAPDAVSVLDARTYEKIDTIRSGAVAVAVSAIGGADAILAQQSGAAVLSFYRAPGNAAFAGTAAGLIALADGGFAVLTDERDGARITLVNADGGLRGSSFTFAGSARELSFDPLERRFITSDGRTIATLSGSLIAAATTAPTATPPVTQAPQTSAPTATTTPTATPTSSARPAGPTALVVVPSTPVPTLFPGAILSAVGVYRYDLTSNTNVVAMAAGTNGRIWYASRDGAIGTIDPATGTLGVVRQLGGVSITRLAFGNDRVFALDANGALFVLNVLDQRLSGASVPFGSSVRSMAVALDGRLWMVSDQYNGLIAFDPRTTQLEIVYLDSSARPSAVSVDGAGRIWFADSVRSTLGAYEPSVARLTYMNVPGNEPFTALRADEHSNVWLGTAGGSIYRASSGSVQLVTHVGTSVLAFARSADGFAVALIDAGQSTLVGVPGRDLTVASGEARSLAVDGSGHIWLGDPQRAVLFIVEPTP